MVKHRLRLQDGTWLSSGVEAVNAIQKVQLTHSVNTGTELDIGSVCAAELQLTLLTPGGELQPEAGSEVALYRCPDEGESVPAGVFILEKPTRSGANTMVLTGYDRVVKLEKDLTGWLEGLQEWPYRLTDFASMVCSACGLEFLSGDYPNGEYLVEKFTSPGVTGRQLMRWLAQVACSFCYADAQGDIRFGWYEPLTTHAIAPAEGTYETVLHGPEGLTLRSDSIAAAYGEESLQLVGNGITVTDDPEGNVTITIPGDIRTLTYREKGLQFEDYQVMPIHRVQLQLGSGEGAYLWPAANEGDNCYVLRSNPMLSRADEVTGAALGQILERLSKVSYTPGKITLPNCLEIRPGHSVTVTDKNGRKLTMYVMTVETQGQKLTLTATGSRLRSDVDARYDRNAAQSAQQRLDAQTQKEAFDRLTENGNLKGIYMENGELYINASYLRSGELDAERIRVINLVAEKVRSVAGNAQLDVDGAELRYLVDGNQTIWMSSSAMPIMYMTDYEGGVPINHCELTPHHLKVGGTSAQPIFEFQALSDAPQLKIGAAGYKTLFWKDNGDGTFTLMGK